MFTDTHCHLYFDVFDADRDQVIERAINAKVVRMLTPGIDLYTSRLAVELAERYPEIYATVGIHPNSAKDWNKGSLAELRDLAVHPKVVAIGEIGLDYYRDKAPKSQQKQIFHEQLKLAAEVGLPVILHNRLASHDMLDILAGWRAEYSTGTDTEAFPGVMHSYSDGLETAMHVLSMGFFLGITGPVTFLNARNLQGVVSSLPIGRLLIETDAPFLTPHPNRGRRNEPANVVQIVQKIASLKDLPIETVAEVTTANADQLFHWREIVD